MITEIKLKNKRTTGKRKIVIFKFKDIVLKKFDILFIKTTSLILI